jgi:hypothetical protein
MCPRATLLPLGLLMAACNTDVQVAPTENLAPIVLIEAPGDQSPFNEGDAIELVGTIIDNNGQDTLHSVTWTSTVDPQLATMDAWPDADGVSILSVTLSAGTHLIELSAIDEGGLSDADSITLFVEALQQEPDAAITSPASWSSFYTDEIVNLTGRVDDLQQDPDTLDIVWTATHNATGAMEIISQAPAAQDGTVTARWTEERERGGWVITLTAIDEDGNETDAEIFLNIELSPDQEPTVSITSPDSYDTFFSHETIPLAGLASDVQSDDGSLDIVWTATETGTGLPQVIYEGWPSGDGSSIVDWVQPSVGNYAIRLEATDEDGYVGYDEIFLIIGDIADEDLDGDGQSPNEGDCDDGDPTAYAGADEVCGDATDNDCNGLVDDRDIDGDAHIDDECVNYDGTLPVDDCDDANYAIHPGAIEYEDGVDNNCDGNVDEGTASFDNDGDCYCAGSACTGSYGSCSSVDPGDCDDSDASINPGAWDEPDMDYVDANCDDIDGDAGASIFLDPVHGSDGATGTSSADPLYSLDAAYDAALATGYDWILIAEGTVSLSAGFDEGVHLAGGYDAGTGWGRSPSLMPTIPAGSSGWTISGWTAATEWQQIRIQASSNTSTGGSSFALRLHSSTGLLLDSCEIAAGNAGNGSNGSTGSSGGNGSGGGTGSAGCEDSSGFCDSCSRPGAGGGGSGCSSNSGGAGGSPGHENSSGSSGSAGSGSGAGSGGSGGSASNSGGTGGKGSNGSAGSNGGAGGSVGGFSTSGYSVSSGSSGGSGNKGAGGGGGGGGGGGNDWCDSYGGAGGGGGGGACGGGGGGGGTGGGASVAILLISSGLELIDSLVETGDGGDGGSGGSGGSGGNGGSGGAGGNGEDDSGRGGDGGDGGDGGTGGHGGGGGGGPSVGVYCSGSTLVIDSDTSFDLGDSGAGGTSSGANGSTGLRANTSGC